jgi:hypothetical protein
MVRDVELGTLCPKFKTRRAPTCLGNFLGNCNYRTGIIPMKAGVFSANSRVSEPTTFPDSRLRIPNQTAPDSRAALDTRVVAISGPRQSGKTTCARRFVKQGRKFFTLDNHVEPWPAEYAEAASRESFQATVGLAPCPGKQRAATLSQLGDPGRSEVTDNVGQSASLGRSAVYRDFFACASPRFPNTESPICESDGRAAVLRR